MANIDLDQMITAPHKAAAARTAALARLADLRWQRETGGMELPDGSSIATTRESQAQITGMAQAIAAGLLSGPVDWKTPGGWQKVPADGIQQMARAVTAHVTRCFAAERAVSERVTGHSGPLDEFDIETAFDTAFETCPRDTS